MQPASFNDFFSLTASDDDITNLETGHVPFDNTTSLVESGASNNESSSGDGYQDDHLESGLLYPLAVSFTLGTLILATVIGNAMVLAAVILERNLHNVANYKVASLAVAGLMVSLLVMPIAAVDEVATRWFLGNTICDLWISFDVLCCTASILHLVAIGLDRYWAITRIDYIQNRSPRKMLAMIACVWIISAFISIPPLFGWKDDNDPSVSGLCRISQDQSYTLYSTIGAFYLPLAFIVVIYAKIFRAARSRIRRTRFRRDHEQGAETSAIVAAHQGEEEGPSVTEAVELTNLVKSASPSLISSRNGLNSRRDLVEEVEPSTDSCQSTPVNHATNRQRQDASSAESLERFIVDKKKRAWHSKIDGERAAGVPPPLANNQVTLSRQETPPSSPLSRNNSPKPAQAKGHYVSLVIDSNRKPTTVLSASGANSVATPKRDRAREKMEQKRERKAARTLAIITGSFICSWLPFFTVAIIVPFCGQCQLPKLLKSVFNWLGYFNSFQNPIIYTTFNPDFRLAFRKILFGKYRAQHFGSRNV